ncbi:uncharacterized protein LOC111390933 [Olea europaea var. sylvestris]|uniref:uncharacterized protein LOC111390933 n=1 Tax=Olea europaea var. sylvestris TaxID=158386 RepID=UPI000C1CE3E2|nr:uncharacterized protein LOC111390933 [Olea europaea var. sylvestris]
MPSYAEFLKDILSNKCKLGDHETVMLIEECSTNRGVQRQNSEKAPTEIESSRKKLSLGEAKATTVTLQLADQSLAHPRGIIDDVLFKVEKFIFPADFLILDTKEDKDIPLIIGKPFLAIGKALINVQNGQLISRLGEEQISFNILKSTQSDSVETETCVRFLDTNPSYTSRRHFEEHGIGPTKPLPFIQQLLKLELKQLLPHIRYAYLGKSYTLLVIISNIVSEVEEEKLLRALRETKIAIRWTIADIKGISPSLCMHKILMEENFRPTIES